MSTNIWFLRVDEAVLGAHRDAHGPIDVEDFLGGDGHSPGLEVVGDTFRGANAFFDDLQRRMGVVAASPWAMALGNGTGRLPPGTGLSPALDDLFAAGWVLLSVQEFEQLRSATRAALAENPEWASAGYGNGPTWHALVSQSEKHHSDLTAIVAL